VERGARCLVAGSLVALVAASVGAIPGSPGPVQDDRLVRPRDGEVLLPAGAVAELLARVDLAAPRAGLDLAWPPWRASGTGESGWSHADPWRRWVELVGAEAHAPTPDPARRAPLAALARAQGRDQDGWKHLVACAADPPTVAALFPLFLPGVPAELAGRATPWPSGVLLAPALPPLDDERTTLRHLAGLALEHGDVRIGGARLSLRVDVDRDGLGVTLHHLEGDAIEVGVAPPVLEGVETGQLFADWERLATTERMARFQVSAEAPEHSLWVSFRPPETRWPAPPVETLPPLDAGRALVLVSSHADARLEHCAEALGALLGVPARVERAVPVEPDGLEPLVVDLDGPRAEEKLVTVLGLAEAFALRNARDRAAGGR